MTVPFPYLLLPVYWSSRNRARQMSRSDIVRGQFFAGIGLLVFAALFYGAFWTTTQLDAYEELGDFLLRIGLLWLFLTFLSFLAFSGVVTALSTFFFSEDLRMLLAAPVAVRRLFYARFAKTVGQSSWMVVIFLMPVLLGVGVARCAPCIFYLTALLTVAPFCVIPVAAGTGVTLLLVNVFPARRARDILMLMGLLFAASIVILLRFIQPERLLRVESLPDVTGFFTTLQSPVTPLLPSFWAGETLFASLLGGTDLLHAAALWTTAAAFTVMLAGANERWYFAGFSRSQEARKARFTRLLLLDRAVQALPLSALRRTLLIKDLKVFLRDVTQWSQLLLLLALVLVYLYNFRVLDLARVPYMSGVIKNFYAFLNLGLASFVMATVAVRFVFPAVSAEGAAFWIIRTSPVSYRDFLWSKFWMGLIPVLLLSEGHDRRQRVSRRGAVSENCDRDRHHLHERRARRPRHGPGRAIPTLQRRQCVTGGGIARRRRVHDRRGVLHHRDDWAARVAIFHLPFSYAPPSAICDPSDAVDGGVFSGRGNLERVALPVPDAIGRASAR